MITEENFITLDEVTLSNINYGFFTNENGFSDAGYLIDGQKTRNVNIYSSEQLPDKGYDSPESILANIQTCFHELGTQDDVHKFFMTSYYANSGKSEPLIISCNNLDYLHELKEHALQNLYYEDENKANPNRLGLEPNMRAAISNSDISVIRADALIFKKIPGESIAVLGPSGDAHSIMMFDDENSIACYIAGAHISIKQGVLEKSFDRMIELGANPENIRVVIGPGLGPMSYEFGQNAPEYFSIPENIDTVLKPVFNSEGVLKYLINIKQLINIKLQDRIAPENIFNTDLDTMGFDLYDELTAEDASKSLQRKTTIDFSELNQTGLLFFGARRTIIQQSDDLLEHNSAAHNTVGRHGAGFALKS